MNKKQKTMLVRILIAAACIAVLEFLPVEGTWKFALYMIPYLVVGYDILRKAGKGILKRQVFDENFLMALATVGAIALGEYREGVAVMLFYQIGELFQSYAVGRSRRNISELMDIRPDYANVTAEDGSLERVDPDEVEIGTLITVEPGEKVPIDGTVVSGESTLDTAALTGESVPRRVAAGDEIISGCINLSGVLTVRTTKEFEESTVSKILDLVENASSQKSRSEAFITRFARVYTPAVVYAAAALAVLPPLVRLAIGLEAGWGDWIFRALTFLVISCPCALVISIPLSFFAGIGGASKEGVLVKGSNYLEALSQTKIVAFDKTGTITEGVFEVQRIWVAPDAWLDRETLVEYAAYAEMHSSHPIAESILKAFGKQPEAARVSDVTEISGHGVKASVSGHEVCVGNGKLMAQLGLAAPEVESSGTVVYVAVDGRLEGYLEIADRVKETAGKAMDALAKAGVRKTVMLTGDRRGAAENVGRALHIDEVHAELLPEDKVALVERLLGEKGPKEKLAFVGDGINDAPVLSRADIGVAMGAMGSDAAIEAADVVLMDDDPYKIAKAIRISRKCMRIVYENIYFAIGVKLVCLALGALGLANMWMAIFADVGVMVIAVCNAIRALRVKHL
ncbi:MAG: cadmium-translocating P-type ATPase [Lachnospiraceae bacterium]|nr:cadmium-translocating P-type ATPase [Lachnospiraceae bacterium]